MHEFWIFIIFTSNRIKQINPSPVLFSIPVEKGKVKYSRLFNELGLRAFVMKFTLFSLHLLNSIGYAFYWSERIFNDLHIACWHFHRNPHIALVFHLKLLNVTQWHLNWIDSYKRNSKYPSSFFISFPRAITLSSGCSFTL